MAKKEAETTLQPVTPRKRRERERKEITTKLQHLGPVARAEVINEALEKTVAKQLVGFTDFIREQSVVGIAIGMVMGTQIKQFVDTIVANFVNPFLGMALPGKGTLVEKTFTLHLFGKTGAFGWGAVANTLLSLISVAVLVYLAFKILHLEKLTKKKEDDKKSKDKKPKKSPKKSAKKDK